MRSVAVIAAVALGTLLIVSGTLAIASKFQSAQVEYDYFNIPTPAAVVTQDSTGVHVYPVPPGCILGIPHAYLTQPQPPQPQPKLQGNYY